MAYRWLSVGWTLGLLARVDSFPETYSDILHSGARIVGGRGLYETPSWMASLRYPNTSGELVHFCGGTLIADRWILTAGHCLKEPREWVQVWMGGNKRTSKSSYDKYNVIEAYRHEEWTKILQNDLLLLKLDRSATTTATSNRCGFRKPIKLHSNPDVTLGTRLEVIGWGVLQYGSPTLPDQLMQASVPVVSRQRCRNSNFGLVTDDQFCAGYPEGKIDACTGDSGGPAFIRGTNGDDTQWGITSWGDGCAKYDRYGVYVNIAAYIDWIVDMMDPDLPYSGTVDVATPELKNYFTEVLQGDSGGSVAPILYIGFNCTLDCPIERQDYAITDGTTIQCPTKDGTMIPPALLLNITVRIGRKFTDTTIKVGDDPRIICRRATELCREVDFGVNNGSVCDPEVHTSEGNRVICRIAVSSLIPSPISPQTLSQAFVVDVSVADTTNRTLKATTLNFRPIVSGLIGKWRLQEAMIRSIIPPSGTESSQDRLITDGTLSTIEVNQALRRLWGHWTLESKDDSTGGEMYCVQLVETPSSYSYDCTFTTTGNGTLTLSMEKTSLLFVRGTDDSVQSVQSTTNYVYGLEKEGTMAIVSTGTYHTIGHNLATVSL